MIDPTSETVPGTLTLAHIDRWTNFTCKDLDNAVLASYRMLPATTSWPAQAWVRYYFRA